MIVVDDLLACIWELERRIKVLEKQLEERDEEIAGLLEELGYDPEDE
jgi:hypothetical protein